MFLILEIKDRDQAVWSTAEKGQVKYQQSFKLKTGEENILLNLDKFLKKNRLSLSKVSGFGLALKEGGLTQVKVIATIMNSLAWSLNRPIAALFYYPDIDILPKLLKLLAKQKKFKQIKPEYLQNPEITISKKKNKFHIVK